MDPDPAGRPGRPAPPDVLQSGSLRAGRAQLGHWLPVILAVLLVLAAVAKIEHAGRRPADRGPVTVTEAGHRLLGETVGWDLFGFSPGHVMGVSSGWLVRVQFARGRVTRTTVPALLSDGPASLIAGPDQVIIRPLDNVPGYLVPDGQPGPAAGRSPEPRRHRDPGTGAWPGLVSGGLPGPRADAGPAEWHRTGPVDPAARGRSLAGDRGWRRLCPDPRHLAGARLRRAARRAPGGPRHGSRHRIGPTADSVLSSAPLLERSHRSRERYPA